MWSLVRMMSGVAVLCVLSVAANAAPCSLNQTNPSVTVCTPAPNALVQSQVNVVAGTTDSHTVTTMQIYVDSKLVYQVKASTLKV